MILKEILKTIIADFHTRPFQRVISRELELPVRSGKIITLTGPRRSGKSYCFFSLINDLVENRGVKIEEILYLNFEDERLQLKASDLNNILQAYEELHPGMPLENCYFFFDEIQNIQGWEKFVRRCSDTITKNIFVTGSNANLLSQEIATALRGRTITYEVLPLSFREFLTFKGSISKSKDSATRAKVNRLFHEYLIQGGFPEIAQLDDNLKLRTLQEYFDVMTYRDLIERYEFSNLSVIKYFLRRVASTTASYLSLNKIYNELRSQGYKLDKNLLYEVNEAAKAVYLSLPVSKFDYSELKRSGSDKKTYFIDNGLLNALTVKFSNDYGKLLENLCYLELRRRAKEVYYYKDVKECDFIIHSDGNEPVPIQICYSLTDKDTLDREIESLTYCCRKLNIHTGYILSMEELPDQTVNGVLVKYLPAVPFFLGEISLP